MDDPEKTYRWLIRGKKNYRFAIDVLIDEIHKAVDDNNHTLALTLMDDIKYTGDQVGAELERAQIRLECASAAFR